MNKIVVKIVSLLIVSLVRAEQVEQVEDAENARWLVEQIHAKIGAESKMLTGEDMIPYKIKLPLANDEEIRMVVIPGGVFKMGTAASIKDKRANEGPQRTVRVAPFWMGEMEVTWALYRNFYDSGKSRKKNGFIQSWDKSKPLQQLLTQPTPLYMDQFENGRHQQGDAFPAMNMNQHAASKFCQWLSAQTGQFYRLPTEAEWEFAARGGEVSANPWGKDKVAASSHAWYRDNSNLTYQKVGGKAPNKYGLYDMLGNVAEWNLDQYSERGLEALKNGSVDPWVVPLKRYSRVIKGGSYLSKLKDLRVGYREGSTRELKALDPDLPKSIWYHTYGQHIGFRVVRPLKLPTVDQADQFWNTDQWSVSKNREDFE